MFTARVVTARLATPVASIPYMGEARSKYSGHGLASLRPCGYLARTLGRVQNAVDSHASRRSLQPISKVLRRLRARFSDRLINLITMDLTEP
jgi:hypothetical protein